MGKGGAQLRDRAKDERAREMEGSGYGGFTRLALMMVVVVMQTAQLYGSNWTALAAEASCPSAQELYNQSLPASAVLSPTTSKASSTSRASPTSNPSASFRVPAEFKVRCNSFEGPHARPYQYAHLGQYNMAFIYLTQRYAIKLPTCMAL
ncbi:hypothetical protein GOP47_0024379 [Adiantum capillus-veneris]|uniref:Uncharacterized protein n=1 Tax=Adiantum capillus-veneris TaxID=13818 RepID=A0A9D4U1T0_ADICA|nr:hypothetical protein GOP47_0024379 [Adiantum capillus-veneris]